MLPIATVALRLSEQRQVFVTLTPLTGTLTISSAVVTLYDASGNVAGGVSAIAVTGKDSGAQSAPRAWFLLRPSVLSIVPGSYTLTFLVTDSSGFIYEPVVMVVVGADN